MRASSLFALAPLSFFFSTCTASKTALREHSIRHPKRTEGGIHLPIYRQELPKVQRRSGETTAIGLGDYQDVTYSVLVTVGETPTPLVLDTGSSDLWVVSDACTQNCTSGAPLYPQTTFQSTGLDVVLQYGDSTTGTQASGPIGADTIGIAGISLPSQYFAAINNTNTSILETGSAGIFGLSFPIISSIWQEVFINDLHSSVSKRHEGDDDPPLKRNSIRNYATRSFPHFNFNRPSFPSAISDLFRPSESQPQPRQQSNTSSLTTSILASWASLGPFLSRLTMAGSLAAPMFTVTLQRDTIDIGGNTGLLSIGELPGGVKNDTLTWVNVRAYTPAQGGLVAPPDSPDEQYPMVWEIFIDDVFLDGQKLPRSTLSAPNLSVSALLDTGNSLLRGPSDVVTAIVSQLGGSRFPCSTPHTLAFQIGGKLFPVDPRDFINQAFTNSVSDCVPNLVATDTPVEGKGFLYSWSLGDPFLKSVQASFYFGNLTHPSKDPPRIGLLSTVLPDAGDDLEAAVSLAVIAGGNFPATSQMAPTGTFSPVGTNSNGVPEAAQTGGSGKPNSALRSGAPFRNIWAISLVLSLAVGGIAL